MRARKGCSLGVACLALAFFAACGSDSSPGAEQTRSALDGSHKGGEVGGPPQEKRDLPASTCVRGSTALGVKGTSIMFAVICRAKSKGATVGFAVSSPEVRSFSRHPTVTGSGTRERFGSCSKDRNRPVECEAHIDGKVRIEGEFKVDPTRRCTIPISITVNEVTGCEGGVCPAALVTREIFAGHPRGC